MANSKGWKHWVFRYRGLLLAVLGLWVLRRAQPSPWSWQLGLCLGLTGELLRIWSFGFSGRITRGLEPGAHILVTAGPYSLTRNPLYLGNLLNALGVMLAASGRLPFYELCQLWLWGGLALTLLYASLIAVEEEFLLAKFGQQYEQYRAQVPALIPRAWRVSSGAGSFSWSDGVRWEATTLLWWLLTWGCLRLLAA